MRSLTPDSGHSSSSPPELAQLFGQVLNRPDVADSDTFVSLGGDSLSYVEMSIRLEERLGFLPADWHVTSVEELARKSKPPVGRPASPLRSDEQRTSGSEPARWRTLETNVVLRALAIVLIVGSHANLFMVLGGAHVLLGVAGFNFGRFRLTPAPRRERVRQLAASTARIVVPSVIWIGIASTFSGYSLTNVLLLNGVLGPRTWAEPEWYFWFVEALAYTLVAMTLLMGIPAVERLERKLPFWLPFSLAILGLLTRYDVLRLVDGDVIHRAHVLFWLFAIGWATAKSTYTWHRLLLSVLVVATVPGFFGDGCRDLVVIAGMLLLLWLRAVRVPSWAARPAGVLASASLYIYLCHWQVYPHWENTHPLFATVLSLVAGVALWKVAGVVTPYVDSGLTRVRRRGRTSPRKPLRSWRPGEPSDIGIGNNHGWLTPRRYAHVSLGKRHGVSPFPPVYARDRIAPRPVHGRVAMISLHTSPLDQPGTGDAGGMNVYVKELSKRLAQRNIGVEIYTRATSSELPPQVEAFPGVTVHHVHAGPFEGLSKDKLPSQLCVFAREVLRAEARHDLGWYDLVHSHYWLSGQVGALVRDRWSVPLAHSMHTMAKVKNESLALGDTPEPDARVIGEEQVVEAADMLVANTDIEARQLVDLYDADPTRVEVVHPGVDLSVFRPVGQARARRRLGLPEDAVVLLFAGRIQPLKAPDLLLHAVDVLLRRDPSLRRRLVVPVVGGPSGSGLDHPESLAQLAVSLGISDVVRFVPPVAQSTLVDWYAAATLVAVPSYNESFGLVAVEAQATGTPVVAAAVGGLTTVVRDGVSGLLVGGHDPHDYARAIERIVRQPALRASLSEGAVRHAADFAWERTADRAVEVYRMASTAMRLDLEELHA